MPAELLFRTREEAEPTSGRPWGRGTTGTRGMTGMTSGTTVATGGGGGGKGGCGGLTRGVRRKGTRGVRRGVAEAHPPPRRRGNVRSVTREWGPGGAGGLIGITGLIGLTHHQVTRRPPAE